MSYDAIIQGGVYSRGENGATIIDVTFLLLEENRSLNYFSNRLCQRFIEFKKIVSTHYQQLPHKLEYTKKYIT